MNKKNMNKALIGFTLVEIVVVIVLIGIIAAFGVPGYGKMIRKSHERNAILGLTSIHQANSIYEAKTGEYLPGNPLTLTQANAGLSIDVKSLDMTYSYARTAASAYTATSAWTGGSNFTVRVDEGALLLGANNPCCTGDRSTSRRPLATGPFSPIP